MDHRIDDFEVRDELREMLAGRKILIIAPGLTLATHKDIILNYIKEEQPIVFSVNFIPEEYDVDFGFFSNNKRYDKIENRKCKTIVTSNLSEYAADYYVDYNGLSGAFDQGCNSLIMLLKFLKDMNVGEIVAAGADGYKENGKNYYTSSIRCYTKHDNQFNLAVVEAIRNLRINIKFLTPSAYDIGEGR